MLKERIAKPGTRRVHIVLSNLFRSPMRLRWRAIFFHCTLLLTAAQALPQSRSTPTTVNQFDSAVDALIKKVSPSVVQIIVTAYAPMEDSGRGSAGAVIEIGRAHV